MSYKTDLQSNNSDLRSILDKINALPDSGTTVTDPSIQALTITENGTYTAPEGVDGYSPVVVNVPNEGITPTGKISITENGTYDVTEYAEAVVEVVDSGSGASDTYFDGMLNGSITEITNDRITTLRNYALYALGNLVSANFPNVTDCAAFSFGLCTKLTQVYLPSLQTLQTNAFRGCKALASFEHENTIYLRAAFVDCTALEYVDITTSKAIEAQTFYGCRALTTFILRNTTLCSLANANAFTNTPIASGTGYIYVPASLVPSYQSATNWSTYSSQIRALELL